jgi:hypothetical protein
MRGLIGRKKAIPGKKDKRAVRKGRRAVGF